MRPSRARACRLQPSWERSFNPCAAAHAGGLPTFVDVGSSFGAPALREDNLLAQLRSRGARVALLGDDTWVQLFPDSRAFSHLHPFPSFNVQDLHTVDSGIKKLLQPLLARPGAQHALDAVTPRALRA